MNRRGFLKAAAGVVAATFIVPELIVPERRVFALDQTMVPDLIIPGRMGNHSVIYIHPAHSGQLQFGPDDQYAVVIGAENHDLLVSSWGADTGKGGIVCPGTVTHPTRKLRTVFTNDMGFIRAEISDRFPKGVGVPSHDHAALMEAFIRAQTIEVQMVDRRALVDRIKSAPRVYYPA